MKRPLFIILLILLFSPSANNQTKPALKLPDPELIIQYDEFKDLTTVRLTAMAIEQNGLDFIALSVHTICYQRGTGKPITAGISILISCDLEAYQEIGSRELMLLVAGERLRLGKREEARQEKTGQRIVQQLTLETGWLTLRRISRAQKVQGQLGNREFSFTQSNLEWLRKFDAKIENKGSL